MIHETGNPGPSWDLLYRVINFATLVGVLYWLLKKPVREFFASRAVALKTAVEEARLAHEVALKQNQEMEARLKNLEKESQTLLATFREEAQAERGHILKTVQAYTERLKGDVKKIADSEVKKAKEELKNVAVGLTKETAEEILRQELRTEDSERLTQSYLNKLKGLH